VIWRDFDHHVLWHHPRVLREPFGPAFAVIRWDSDTERLEAWKQGRTGFPVIDAAMRELMGTGFMHNRARMIAASFLAKDLLLDWRLGEAHFMEHLADGDVASNDGGWQWAASVGTDPPPYFRIFNPHLQAKRFDPDGAYVRRWVPELRQVPARYLQEPHLMPPGVQEQAGCAIGEAYPYPIVDHGAARARALAAYRAACRQSCIRSS
jgi:deoxyribodipyrimidine photo-lyase